jgi:hypothetical protein
MSKDTAYYTSGNHADNVNKARIKAVLAHNQKRLDNIEKYNLNPKLCKFCTKAIDYDKKINNFCSSTCSASNNNLGRKRSEESLKKTSKTLKEHYTTHDSWSKGKILVEPTYDISITCKICSKISMVNYKKKANKTCSRECSIKASFENRSYVNGKRKTIPYFCKTSDTIVKLESTWEVKVAKVLDSLNISWIRPVPLRWIDNNGKKRLYFSDFYLPDHDTYVDPKNPYCMQQDIEKMKYFIDRNFKIIFGNVNDVINKVKGLT